MNIEQEIEAIKRRNQYVEADKAWETSIFRIISVSIITYIIAVAFLYLLGNPKFLLNAFLPVVGYVLSTQALPSLKRRWISRYLGKRK